MQRHSRWAGAMSSQHDGGDVLGVGPCSLGFGMGAPSAPGTTTFNAWPASTVSVHNPSGVGGANMLMGGDDDLWAQIGVSQEDAYAEADLGLAEVVANMRSAALITADWHIVQERMRALRAAVDKCPTGDCKVMVFYHCTGEEAAVSIVANGFNRSARQVHGAVFSDGCTPARIYGAPSVSSVLRYGKSVVMCVGVARHVARVMGKQPHKYLSRLQTQGIEFDTVVAWVGPTSFTQIVIAPDHVVPIATGSPDTLSMMASGVLSPGGNLVTCAAHWLSVPTRNDTGLMTFTPAGPKLENSLPSTLAHFPTAMVVEACCFQPTVPTAFTYKGSAPAVPPGIGALGMIDMHSLLTRQKLVFRAFYADASWYKFPCPAMLDRFSVLRTLPPLQRVGADARAVTMGFASLPPAASSVAATSAPPAHAARTTYKPVSRATVPQVVPQVVPTVAVQADATPPCPAHPSSVSGPINSIAPAPAMKACCNTGSSGPKPDTPHLYLVLARPVKHEVGKMRGARPYNHVAKYTSMRAAHAGCDPACCWHKALDECVACWTSIIIADPTKTSVVCETVALQYPPCIGARRAALALAQQPQDLERVKQHLLHGRKMRRKYVYLAANSEWVRGHARQCAEQWSTYEHEMASRASAGALAIGSARNAACSLPPSHPPPSPLGTRPVMVAWAARSLAAGSSVSVPATAVPVPAPPPLASAAAAPFPVFGMVTPVKRKTPHT